MRTLRNTYFWVAAGIAVVLVLVVGALALAPADDAVEPTVTGDTLPRLDAAAPEAALGMTAPEVTGQDFDGDPVVIEPDGTPKAIIFLTHW